MALIIKDRVLETCSSPGSGTVSLLGAIIGYQTFNAAVTNGNTCYYTIADQNGSNWEVGLGTFTAPASLARTTVLASSNGGTLVNFSSGVQNVFLTYPASKAVTTDTLAYPPAIGSTTPNTGAFTTFSANGDSSFTSTGYLQLPKGTTGEQPGSPVTGMVRYNTTTNVFEGYSGSPASWNPVGNSVISNDTSTASNLYPVFIDATTGVTNTIKTGNANLLYKPSTGELQAQEMVAINGLVVNNATINISYSLPSGYNAMSAGPVTVASGITVTVPSGSTWTVV